MKLVPKKILIATKFFHPDITPRSFRASELAKEFARQGHEVTVLTTERDFDYSELEKIHNFRVLATVKNEPNQIQGGGIKRIVRFVLQRLFYYPFILLSNKFSEALKKHTGYDLLVSIAHPFSVHFGVALAKKHNPNLCKTWVADCGDPFVGNGEGRLPVPFYFKWVESWFCKKPNFITIPIEDAKPAYPENCQHKIKVIPQGFDFSEIRPNYEEGLNKMPTFAYAGMLGVGTRDPRPFLDMLCSLNQDFKFIVYTKNESLLEPYQKRLGNKLEVRSYVPREQLLSVLGQMDFLINFENKSDVQKPSKLIDYALLQRPTLSIKPFDINKVVLKEFLEGDYRHQIIIDDVSCFNIKNVTNKFLSLIKDDSKC